MPECLSHGAALHPVVLRGGDSGYRSVQILDDLFDRGHAGNPSIVPVVTLGV
jgi:hypothetical protein